jgi:predicted nucleic acid-binding protein
MGRRSKRTGLPLAVVDNTLLTRLVNLDIAEFLPYLFKQILIPPEVKREAYKAPHKGKRRLRKIVGEMAGFFIDCYEANDFTKEYLKADLDEGEAAAIAQAEVTGAIILIDELKGFKIAKNMQLGIIRTGKLLIMLKEAGALTEVQPYLQKLKKAGFRMDEEVLRQLLAEAGEQQSD